MTDLYQALATPPVTADTSKGEIVTVKVQPSVGLWVVLTVIILHIIVVTTLFFISNPFEAAKDTTFAHTQTTAASSTESVSVPLLDIPPMVSGNLLTTSDVVHLTMQGTVVVPAGVTDTSTFVVLVNSADLSIPIYAEPLSFSGVAEGVYYWKLNMDLQTRSLTQANIEGTFVALGEVEVTSNFPNGKGTHLLTHLRGDGQFITSQSIYLVPYLLGSTGQVTYETQIAYASIVTMNLPPGTQA